MRSQQQHLYKTNPNQGVSKRKKNKEKNSQVTFLDTKDFCRRCGETSLFFISPEPRNFQSVRMSEMQRRLHAAIRTLHGRRRPTTTTTTTTTTTATATIKKIIITPSPIIYRVVPNSPAPPLIHSHIHIDYEELHPLFPRLPIWNRRRGGGLVWHEQRQSGRRCQSILHPSNLWRCQRV